MPLKGGKRKYKKKRQRKTKRKPVKKKHNKKKKKMTRKLNLKGGDGLFENVQAFIGLKPKPPAETMDKKEDNKKCPPSTGDRINNLFSGFRKTAENAAGAAKNAGNQALGEVNEIAKGAKDKVVGAADGAKSALIGKDSYTWDEMKKSYESGFDDAKANKEKFDSLEKLKHKDKDELTKEEKEKKLKEEKEKEDKKDDKMQEVKISADDKDDKKSDKDDKDDKKDDKDKLKKVDLNDKELEDSNIILDDDDSLFDIETIDDNKLK